MEEICRGRSAGNEVGKPRFVAYPLDLCDMLEDRRAVMSGSDDGRRRMAARPGP